VKNEISRKLEEEDDEDDEGQERIRIHMDNDVELTDVFDLDKKDMDMKDDNISLDVEEL